MEQECPYIVELGPQPPICLPRWIDRSKLHDVTCIGDSWRKYMDDAGKIYDGAIYAEKAKNWGLPGNKM